MRQSKILLLGWLLAGIVVPAWPGSSARAADPPVTIDCLGVFPSKPPLKWLQLHLTLTNAQDKAVWLILPYRAEEKLPEKGIFPGAGWLDQPFESTKFAGDGESAVEVLMLGGFRAFRLPAKAILEFECYKTIGTWKDLKEIKTIAVMEARDLKVNGKTPLEKWLPYDTTSGKKVKVSEAAKQTYLDYDYKKYKNRDDYPKEKVEKVTAEGIRTWTVKIQHKAEKKAP